MRGAILILACIGALSRPVAAEPLVIGVATETTSLDPHYQNLGPNHDVMQHLFDRLVHLAPDHRQIPGLALSWRLTEDPLVWEFKLRPNVRFHDGQPFTADDVVFSFARAPDVPGAPSTYSRSLRDVAETIKVDALTVRLRTREPAPILPNNIASVAIVSHRIGREAAPADFASGRALIGTGPFRFVSHQPAGPLVLEANPDHWGGAPKWSRVTIRPIPNPGARVAALLARDVDLINTVPPTALAQLRQDARVAVAEGISNRVIFWQFDLGRETSPHFTAKDGAAIPNPLRDPRVRQAINLAIDRRAIVERVMEGVAVPASQIVPAGFTGHGADIPVPAPDPARARALLAEAGLADGFRLVLHSTNNRYVNDAKAAQAVGQMLARVGIQVEVTAIPVQTYFTRARAREFGFLQVGWGSFSGDAALVMREALHSTGANNYGGWVNPAFDRLIDQADREMNPVTREGQLVAAMKLAVADHALIPTHFQVNLWATRRGLTYDARVDESTLATAVK